MREDLLRRSLYKLSTRAGKISVRDLLEDLCTRSLKELSALSRSPRKLSRKDLLVKIYAQDLLDYKNELRATRRAI